MLIPILAVVLFGLVVLLLAIVPKFGAERRTVDEKRRPRSWVRAQRPAWLRSKRSSRTRDFVMCFVRHNARHSGLGAGALAY